jgi:hypothetical protein
MNTISIFGETLNTEYTAVFGNAVHHENVTDANRTHAMQSREQLAPCEISWEFESTGGARGIYATYSSIHEMSCDIIVNGKVVQQKALFEPTNGTKLIDTRYQCSVELTAGVNRLTLRSSRTIPKVHALIVADPPSYPQPTIDEYYDLLQAERSTESLARPLRVQTKDFKELLGVARQLGTDHAAIAKLASVASQAVTASIEHVSNGQAAIPWGGPLNGQRYRQHVMDRLMRLGCDAIIETGTFLGTSTAFFAQRGLPVHSCELRDEFFAAALSQLAAFDNVTLHLTDSRAFLKELAGDPAITYRNPFFYLDAHWYDDLPIADEIRIIQSRWDDYVIMVDDFHVPESGYNFDKYSNGLELTLSHLKKEGIDLNQMAVLFPTAMHTAETSVKRGTLILTPVATYAQHLTHERSVYRYRGPVK